MIGEGGFVRSLWGWGEEGGRKGRWEVGGGRGMVGE